jgi:hypothetical protein
MRISSPEQSWLCVTPSARLIGIPKPRRIVRIGQAALDAEKRHHHFGYGDGTICIQLTCSRCKGDMRRPYKTLLFFLYRSSRSTTHTEHTPWLTSPSRCSALHIISCHAMPCRCNAMLCRRGEADQARNPNQYSSVISVAHRVYASCGSIHYQEESNPCNSCKARVRTGQYSTLRVLSQTPQVRLVG